MCARDAPRRHGTHFPSISIPSSFFLFFFSRSKWSIDFGCFLALWAGLLLPPIPFSPDFSVIEPIQTPPIFSFSWLGHYYTHVRTSHNKAQHCCHFDIVFYTGKKFGVPLVCCCTNNDNSSGIISFLFLSLSRNSNDVILRSSDSMQ